MSADALKLTTYLGERDRAGGRYLADALVELYARRGLAASVVLRGAQGFGLKHHDRSDRLLSLSEDLPIVTVAVDRRPRVEAAIPEVAALCGDGLITLERAGTRPDARSRAETKLTVYLGRGQRPGHVAVVEILRRHGVAGATVLLGVDGTVRGRRERARFLAANARVPVMVIAVGPTARVAAAADELHELPARPLVTFERVRVLKRDGVLLDRPRRSDAADPSGLRVWTKLSVFCSEGARHDGRPLYLELVRALRAAGAAGATALRGVWGFHGDHAPHGDVLWQLRRRVPVLVVAVDAPERADALFGVVDGLTRRTGLVTSELVPAVRATAPDGTRGGLRVARPRA